MSERGKEFKAEVQKLRDQGLNVWSISRINTAHQCPREYYLHYVLGLDGDDNIYGYLGENIHDLLEMIQNKQLKPEGLRPLMEKALEDAETEEHLFFINDKVKDGWKNDVLDFCDKFNGLDVQMETELGLIFKIGDEYFQGFIDCLITDEDGNMHILDWKTSAMFEGDALIKSGRQLILYKLGYEQIYNKPIKDVSWFMIKYNTVDYKGKKQYINRRRVYDTVGKYVDKELKKMGYKGVYKAMFLNNFKAKKDINVLPDDVKNVISIDDCIIKYDVTPDLIDETKGYILSEIDKIKNRGNNIEEWETCNIKQNEFYCKNLCGQKNNCEAYKKYVEEKRK